MQYPRVFNHRLHGLRNACLALFTFVALSTANNAHAVDIDWSVQIRPRVEKNFGSDLDTQRRTGTPGPGYRTTQRSRANLELRLPRASAFVSVQDIRTFGQTHTINDFSADGLDFHQAWGQLGGAEDSWALRFGRQEFILDEQRLIGAPNWAQQSRSHEGIKLVYAPKNTNHRFTLFAGRAPDERDHDVFVAHSAMSWGGLRLAIPIIVQTNGLVDTSDRVNGPTDNWTRTTAGIHLAQKGRFSWRLEGYGQFGDNLLAYMASARAQYAFCEQFSPRIWVDYLSGDSNQNDNRVEAFSTIFGANHAVYGLMDRFLDIPATTENGGLIDAAIGNTFKLGRTRLQIEAHLFSLAQQNASGREGLIGQETDIIYTIPVVEYVNLQFGVAAFVDLGDYRNDQDPDIHDWFYAQIDLHAF